MQGYKVKEKTAIVPPVSKLSGHPAWEIHVKYHMGILVLQFSVQDLHLIDNNKTERL
jgi:hypothetical protein